MNIIVIGCGISGLTTGLRLLETGRYIVSIWAEKLPPHTTSNVAAAVWYPYKAYPVERVTSWGEETVKKLEELQSDEGSGITMTSLLELKSTPNPKTPWWAKAVKGLRQAQ